MNARRIFAGVSGSPGSVHALRQAAELAHQHDALLIPLLAWLPPGSGKHPWPELRQLWHDDAWQRLWTPSMPPSVACPPVSPPSPRCCAATPARC